MHRAQLPWGYLAHQSCRYFHLSLYKSSSTSPFRCPQSCSRNTYDEVTSYDVIVITRRHVGGILHMNKDGLIMRKIENTYSKVIYKSCFSTGV